MTGYYIIIGAIALVSWIVSARLKSKFQHYSKVHLQNGMSGAEIAEKMLADNGIHDVKVVSTAGMLTDHYNPRNKTVNLSEGVYHQRNAAAAAVAAHECGHAVQHAKSYQWLTMRSKLVPMVSVTSGMSTWLVFGGLILGAAAGVGLGYWIAVAGLAMMALATVFSFVTLPVEYDASKGQKMPLNGQPGPIWWQLLVPLPPLYIGGWRCLEEEIKICRFRFGSACLSADPVK